MTGRDHPMNYLLYELKHLALKRPDAKTPIGLVVEDKGPGALQVSQVRDGTPAASSGLIAGDYVMMINGHRIRNKNDMRTECFADSPNLRLTLCRRRSSPIDPEEVKPPDGERKSNCNYLMCRLDREYEDIGMDITSINKMPCVKVVMAGGMAAVSGLRPNDRILTVGGTSVKDTDHFNALMDGTKGDLVDVLIERPSPASASAISSVASIRSYRIPEVRKPSSAKKKPQPVQASTSPPKTTAAPAPAPAAAAAAAAPANPPPPLAPASAPEPAAAAPPAESSASGSLTLAFQSFREQTGHEWEGVPAVPPDVQETLDACRNDVIAKVLKAVACSSSTAPAAACEKPRSAQKRVKVQSDLSIKPLKKSAKKPPR